MRELPSFLDMLAHSQVKLKNMMPRWWLACDYEPMARTEDGLGWELRGPGVKVMTETDFVAADGSRTSTGKKGDLAQKWADTMTAHYDELSLKMPIFGQLRNLMDLCVVWGGNVQSGAYRNISFSNDQWTCSWGAGNAEDFNAFNHEQASNNHMVTDDPDVAKSLRTIRVGDQVRVQGYLVDYTVFKDGKPNGTRVSSEVRTDTGNGACEVLYVEAVSVTRSAGHRWRLVQNMALVLLLLSVLTWLLLPARAQDLG